MATDLYHIKQQFTLGAYRTLVKSPLPPPSEPDYIPILVYHARAHIALHEPDAALAALPRSDELAFRAASCLAKYAAAKDAGAKESVLEELRDLCVEMEGDDVDERDQGLVRVLAGTAFAQAEEIEEALETLGAGTDTENLEAVALIVQIYLSIHRADLAKKEFERAKLWAEDDLLLQLIESTIVLVTGTDSYATPQTFYTEQISNPAVSSPHLLAARGVTRVLRNEWAEAKSDLEEALTRQGSHHADTLAALVVAAELGAAKRAEAEDLWSKLTIAHPAHPMVVNVAHKAAAFDELASKFVVPPPA